MSMHAAGLPVSPELGCRSPREAVIVHVKGCIRVNLPDRSVGEKKAAEGNGDRVGRAAKGVGRSLLTVLRSPSVV